MNLNEKNPSMDFFRRKCKENALKVTPQRIVIYKELQKSKDHPNAEVLYQRIKNTIPDISLDTVNRTLVTFSKIGIIGIVEGYGEPRRFDPDLEVHHHFRCVNCNEIIDFSFKPYEDIPIPGTMKKGYKVLSKKVLLEGYCNKC
jgi:Fur family peroxide stress response transcriptional regulator